jgi:uncharacterized protein
MKRALFVHGWKGFPENAWFPWLKRELELRGFEVDIPQLPDPWIPDRGKWVEIVGSRLEAGADVIVAHSLGVPTALFALQEHEGPPIERVVCVAGFMRPFPIPGAAQWFGNAEIDITRVKPKSRHWSVIHGSNDPLVPYREGEYLAGQLGVQLITNARFHMTQVTMCFELPEALQEVIG